MAKAFSSAWLECGLYNNLITDFFNNACNSVSQSVVSAVDKASFLANKNVVVGVIFATNAFLGYVGNG